MGGRQEVGLFDPVPAHVERAGELAGVTARPGDARALPVRDAGADAVLLLGPLYHLAEHADRIRALSEARRALESVPALLGVSGHMLTVAHRAG
ncbi:class I SAM-dependent methyltransferase [Streptosporangium sp. NPDC051022]|uniref:class I SAM-dependent methyltransferase n=1 Tax=Streptosporangium sp. NPDC051022 TaxID=3155752 RepID=UPI00341721A0